MSTCLLPSVDQTISQIVNTAYGFPQTDDNYHFLTKSVVGKGKHKTPCLFINLL